MSVNARDEYWHIRFRGGIAAMAHGTAADNVQGRKSFADRYGVSLAELDRLVNEWRKGDGLDPPFGPQPDGNVHPFRPRSPQSPSGEPLTPKPPEPLSFFDVASDPIPPRDWAVRERIPARNVSLLSGEGAIGKSILLLQLAASTVLSRDWLGTVPEPGAVMYLSCEDDDAEIRRRLEAIAEHYKCSRKDMMANGLQIYDFVGKEAALGQLERNDRIVSTPLFKQIEAEAVRVKPKLIIIDTVADVFAGNENNRLHTRQFISLMRGLAVESGAAVVMASHPSLTGISSDTGMSGSTAWHNSVRARAYFKTPDDVEDRTLRLLEWRKSNYGPISESILLRWKSGVYVPEPGAGSLEQMAEDAKIDALFLDLLRQLTKQGRNVTDRKSPSYAPAVFEGEPDAKKAKVSRKRFAEAMARLFAANKIIVKTEGPPSHPRTRIAEVEREASN